MAILNVHNGPTIAAGASESDVQAIGDDFIVGLVCPDAWTPAVGTLLVSVQGDNYLDLFDGKGEEFVFNITPGTVIAVDPHILLMAAYVRLRSGTRDNPVPQEAMRRFYLIGTSKLALTTGTQSRRGGK
jgi:hypothetical protein